MKKKFTQFLHFIICITVWSALMGGSQTASAQANAANYSFSRSTTASLTDMSSGTTSLIAANQDDIASSVTSIGFDFYFMGARQTQFSVNSNGSLRFGATAISTTLYDPLAQAGQSLITAYGADQRTHTTGKVHYKVTGTAPTRCLVVEWLNMQADFNSGGTADLTYQVRIYETTGVIELIHGSINMSANGAADPNSQSPQFGFSSNSTVGNVGSVTAAQSGTPAPTFSGASATPVNNLYTSGAITALTSIADGFRNLFTLTPPAVTAPGTPLSFTSVSATGMTLNWTDSPNELSYAIYQSTNGVNYSFYGTAAQNATSLAVSGLFASTTYYWQVYAISEGALNGISGNQATTAANAVTSISSGLWSQTTTWSSGTIPTTNDAVTITDGTTVTIDMAAVAYNITVGQGTSGVLQFEQTTARTLTASTDVTVTAGGIFQSNTTGTQTGHILSLGGNLVNNGTLEFSTNANTAGAGITFTGATSNTFSGSGAVTDVRTVTINKGTSNANILELTTSNFTVRGSNIDNVVGGFLVMTNGTFKISGTFAITSRMFAAAGYTIPATFGVWLNNPNFTVAGQNGSPTLSGLLRISQGTFNVGTATGNSMGFSANSTIIIEGGTVNVSGRFGVAAAANAINYTQSGGTVTVCTVGNASATLGSFDLGTSTSSTISLTGGTIINQINATAIDYRNQAGGGIAGVTGGTLQLGNASSGAAKTFNLRGVLPNVVISNASANHSAAMSTTLVNYNNISLNITINTGNTFNFGNVTFLFNGTSLVNNGTLTHNGASSNFVFYDNGISNMVQTVSGSGVVTAPMTSISVQTSTVSLTTTNQVITNRVNLFAGSVIGSAKLTIGNGGATTGIIQVGNTTTATNAGVFDAAPTFNLGTGGFNISYLRYVNVRSTGFELPPTRLVTNITLDNNDPNVNYLTMTGGKLTASGTITLTNGRIVTGTDTLYASSTSTVTRTNGYVEGYFKKNFAAAGSKTYEVGTANGYSPATVNVTAGTFPTDITVKAVQKTQPLLDSTISLHRYWNVAATGMTADMTFNYLAGDVYGTESTYSVVAVTSGTVSVVPSSVVNTVTHAGSVTGQTNFGDFSLSTPCSGAVGGTASGTISFCSSGTPTITATGYSTGTTSNYQWQSSNDNFVTDSANIAGQDVPSALNTGTVSVTTWYRLRVMCATGGAIAYSNIVKVTINPNLVTNISSAICQNDSLLFGGQYVKTAGTYSVHLTSSAGCDSLVALALTVKSNSSSNISSAICQNDSLLFNGQYVKTAGTYTMHLASSTGCDSLISLALTVKPNSASNISSTICQNDSLLFNGQYVKTAGTYTMHLASSSGCDSLVTLALAVNPNTTANISSAICQNDSLLFNGQYVKTAGTYTMQLSSSAGCDSLVTLALTVNPNTSSNISSTICQGDSLLFGAQYLKNAGTYTLQVSSSAGCDSLITLTLNTTLVPTASITGNALICNGSSTTLTATGGSTFQWNNGASSAAITVSPAMDSTYKVIVSGSCGTDSTSVLVVVNPTYNSADSASVCMGGSYIFADGTVASNITSNIVHTSNLQTTNACDSIIVTTVYAQICTGIGAYVSHMVTLYPNPSNGLYTLTLGEASKISLVDVLSNVVYTRELPKGSNAIDIRDLPNGTYMMNVFGNTITKTIRLVKQQ